MRLRLIAKAGTLALLAFGFGSSSAPAYTLKTLYSFCSQSNCADGRLVRDSVMMGASGTLYGVTYSGGPWQNAGVVYALIPNAGKTKWTYKQLHAFCSDTQCTDGKLPVGKPIEDVNGNLYGAAYASGSNGPGTIFKLTPKGRKWSFKVIYAFCQLADCADGLHPESGLTYAGAASGIPYDGVSPLYGTTHNGPNGNGVVFSLTAKNGRKWTEKVLSSMPPNTFLPTSALTMDGGGNLFGVNIPPNGGVFEVSPKNAGGKKWISRTIFSFSGNDGDSPFAEPLVDASGNLLGTASHGGANSAGVVYKLAPQGKNWQGSVAYDFCSLSDCADGAYPQTGFAFDASSHLIGTTTAGGGHDIDESAMGGGTVFSLDGSTLTTLYAFCAQTDCNDGEYPFGTPAVDGSGNIFGTTIEGGTAGGGTVFELVP